MRTIYYLPSKSLAGFGQRVRVSRVRVLWSIRYYNRLELDAMTEQNSGTRLRIALGEKQSDLDWQPSLGNAPYGGCARFPSGQPRNKLLPGNPALRRGTSL